MALLSFSPKIETPSKRKVIRACYVRRFTAYCHNDGRRDAAMTEETKSRIRELSPRSYDEIIKFLAGKLDSDEE